MPIPAIKVLTITLFLTAVMACDDDPAPAPADDDRTPALEQTHAEEEQQPLIEQDFFFEIDGVPQQEEHHVTLLRVTEEFETELHAEPDETSPTTGTLELGTEAVLGQAGVSDGVSNLPFERSRVVIPGHPMEATAGFEVDGLRVEPGQSYHLLPVYAGEGTHQFYIAVDGEVRETFELPAVALDGMDYDAIYDLGKRLRDHDDAQWWVHITLSADERGWFRVDRDELTATLEEVEDW